MTDCDVVICGAGISGLLLAAEVSKYLSVVVIERNPRSACSNKFWLTSRQSLECNPELEAYIDSRWSEMEFIASTGDQFTAKSDYVLWDTHRLEAALLATIASNGANVLYEHRFYTYNYAGDRIIARANNCSFRAALLVDCMGFASPIVSGTGSVRILGYHHLYGRVLQLKKEITPVAADNVILSDSPALFEVFPRADGKANAVLIAPAASIRSTQTLAQEFNFIVEKSHYSAILEKMPGGEILQGVVPVGVVNSPALNRILFFGEAGQLHPAATGTCLTRLLLQYKSVAAGIRRTVEAGRLQAQDLARVTRPLGGFATKFHQSLFLEQTKATSSRGKAFIELLGCLDQKSVDDLIFGEITLAHFLQPDNLARVIRNRNFVWLRPLLRTLII
ncbi:MAG TPA: lycopene cyclase family protein [Allosphingosinicella sp.]|nr:lycopene cyclase family protein [Allosphingosinicella sp.]